PAPAARFDPVGRRAGIPADMAARPLSEAATPSERISATTLLNWCPVSADFQVCHRSEEHTSELQSQSNLVCRLLLEKKKIKQHQRGSLRSQRDSGGQGALRNVVPQIWLQCRRRSPALRVPFSLDS